METLLSAGAVCLENNQGQRGSRVLVSSLCRVCQRAVHSLGEGTCRPSFALHRLWPPGLCPAGHTLPPLKSNKSNTYGSNVVKRIIGAGQVPPDTTQTPTASAAAPAVRRVTVDEGSAGQRLDNFLLRELKGVPKTHVYRVIRAGEVRVNKGRAHADTRLEIGDEVRIPPVRLPERPVQPEAPAREFPVVFEDEHLLVIDKPAGVAVHGGSGVSYGVIEALRRSRPTAKFLELVHRLDKETSGLLMIAKKRSALVNLQDQLRDRETGKTYAALVWGDWPAKLKVIDVPLVKFVGSDGERWVRPGKLEEPEAKRSISLVKVVQRTPQFSLLDVTIKTGRTHQIRVHLQQAGHAIVGDPKYGDFERNRELARGPAKFDRMFLHARRLQFTHPATAVEMALEAPLPPECEKLTKA
ncbi:MAG: RluA family pseudouridine synthase [Burkholderiales bacterium]|nr:RluA family pseudouridine synthase [Burkholderiales bacterium]